jgi:hypothetical protein
MPSSQPLYEIRPRKDHRGVDLISDALAIWSAVSGEPDAISNGIRYAKYRSRSQSCGDWRFPRGGQSESKGTRTRGSFKDDSAYRLIAKGCKRITPEKPVISMRDFPAGSR